MRSFESESLAFSYGDGESILQLLLGGVLGQQQCVEAGVRSGQQVRVGTHAVDAQSQVPQTY